MRPREAVDFQVTPHKCTWEVTWKRWSHWSTCNKNDVNNTLSQVIRNRFKNYKWNGRTMSMKPKIYRDRKSAEVQFWSIFGNPKLDRWWMMAWTNWKWGNFLLLTYIWPWRSRSINPKNNRDLNKCVLLFWSKFGDSSLKGWQAIARTGSWLTHGRAQTDADNDNTRRPKMKITSSVLEIYS